MPRYNVLLTDATTEPVTLEQVKLQCRIEHSDLDTHLEGLIKTARKHVEAITRRTLLPQTRKLVLDAFPSEGEVIKLLYPPVTDVSSITYVDTSGTTQTWSSSNYIKSLTSEPARIATAYNVQWPITREQIDAVTVNYTVGYASADAVPQPLKQAILLLVESFYESGMEMSKYTESAVKSLCSYYMVPEYPDE